MEDVRNQGLANGRPSVLLLIYRQPGANIIETVARVRAALPQLQHEIPRAVDLRVTSDRTNTIRASLHAVEIALVIAIVLVVGVVMLFLRDARAAWIPGVAVPVSLIGTFGVMYLLGYSLNTLSLMALTVATGFVVDDAVVVLENISRHIEAGKSRVQAALIGAHEVGFTVLSMSISLVAVFIPILLMGGIIGRLFREFAMTISIAILISLVISLTTTPMMCAHLLRTGAQRSGVRFLRWSERGFAALSALYARSLRMALAHSRIVAMTLLAIIGLNVYLFTVIPKGFFPQQDTGRLFGGIRADQNVSFQAMREKLARFIAIVGEDPAVANVVGFTGSGQTNSGFVFIVLKPREERQVSSDEVIGRLRKRFTEVAGATLILQAVQDIRAGGRPSNAQFQYTLQADSLADLRSWTPRLADALRSKPELSDVDSDQQDSGLETRLEIDRETASRLGISMSQISNTLYDAFGQRQVSTIYNPLNQYRVVMEVAAPYQEIPDGLDEIYVAAGGAVRGTQATNAVSGTISPASSDAANPTGDTAAGSDDAALNQRANQIGNAGRSGISTGSAVSTRAVTIAPLSAFSRVTTANAPLAVNHQGHFVAATISFNIPPGKTLGEAVETIEQTMREIGMPTTIQRQLPGHSAILSAVSRQPAVAAACCPGLGLHRAWHSLRELHPSAHHPLHTAFGRSGCGVGIARLPHRVQLDRAGRRHPADRHRQEERNHDGRLRARRRRQARSRTARGDFRGLPAALPTDHDDDDGGLTGGHAARGRRGRGG